MIQYDTIIQVDYSYYKPTTTLLSSLSLQTLSISHLMLFVAARVVIIFLCRRISTGASAILPLTYTLCHGISSSLTLTLTFTFRFTTSSIDSLLFCSGRVRNNGSPKAVPPR